MSKPVTCRPSSEHREAALSVGIPSWPFVCGVHSGKPDVDSNIYQYCQHSLNPEIKPGSQKDVSGPKPFEAV